jgi:DNA-binding NarL/FixJ family response regulator
LKHRPPRSNLLPSEVLGNRRGRAQILTSLIEETAEREGLTNREIAQALFITTKTAKAHLSRVYRKLGITRRGQLATDLR